MVITSFTFRVRRGAFTLVEMMIVVAVIGLLAAIAIPNFIRARENAANARYSSDVQVATTAFIQYSFDNGRYPADTTPGVVPEGMDDYLTRVHWTLPDALGGKWDWDYRQFGAKAGVSSYKPKASTEQLQHYDEMADDGDLETGGFHHRSDGYLTLIEP
jgi:prepilin-type N-terminal cleavage/methylation domain-containing protein